jgi:hypothetical protein
MQTCCSLRSAIAKPQTLETVHQQQTQPLNSTPLATLIKKGVWGDIYRHFEVLMAIRTQKLDFGNFWIGPRILLQFDIIHYVLEYEHCPSNLTDFVSS